MAVVLLPSLLAAEAGGRGRFDVDGARTVADALRSLPVADLLFDTHGELRRLVNVYVDGRDVRLDGGVDTALRDDATVRVIAAIAGG
jgi:molybdopterin converting factor small subunit